MTPNEIIGSLVYRTNCALNKNQRFLDALKAYYYYPAVSNDDGLHLWHFPGTSQEISDIFQALSKDTAIGSQLKFPGVLNFQGVLQEHRSEFTVLRYNLAIIAPVLSDWTTQQREEQVYKLLLQPIEDEFIRQIGLFPHFKRPLGPFPYRSIYIPTTGKALNSMMKVQYGDFLDAIEFPNLSINMLKTCERESNIIVNESNKVTDEIKNLRK
jgi:hypothetical protein